MIPQRFAESNIVMTRPADMTAEECFDIHAFRDGTQVVTAWRPTPAELVKINMGGADLPDSGRSHHAAGAGDSRQSLCAATTNPTT